MSSEPLPIYTLPLFPLHFVLFPQFPLQLHIFEDRYRAMISECIERDLPFGVVLISEGEETGAPAKPHAVGCLARILAVKTLDDGRMHLLAMGEKRFRILEYAEAELPYLVGRVETIDDHEWPVDDPERPLVELHRLFKKYLRLLGECSGVPLPQLALPDEPSELGFCIAAVTQLPSADKQDLLEMTDPQARLKTEKRLLRRQIRELETLKSSKAPESPDAAEAAEIPARVARRLDTSSDFWKSYVERARN